MQENQNEDELKINSEETTTEINQSPSATEESNIIINIPKENENSETLTIKPKIKSEFENHIIKAYKKLIGLDIPLNENENDQKNKKEANNDTSENTREKEKISIPKTESESRINVKQCEKEIRLALESCIESKVIILNKNILDKMGRIVRHNKINLLFIIGKIYMNLMSKDYLFNPSNKNIDMPLLILFCNEVISLNSLLKQTYLGNKYNQCLINFIIKIMHNYKLENDQLSVMKEILETHNINQKPIKVKTSSYEDMVKSINDNLIAQEYTYGQYKFIYENNEAIYNMIKDSNIVEQNDLNSLNHYLDLGKIFAYLLFNKKYVVYLKRQTHEDEIQGIIKTMFDGYEDNMHISVIEGEKFYVDYDEDIEKMREDLCDLIIKYVEKYKDIKNLFEFQYVLYVLVKRIYFHFYDKYKDKIEPLLTEIMTNLCFFKVDTIEEVKIFLNEILKSDKEKDANLKKMIQDKLEEYKSNQDFHYQFSGNEQQKEDENETNEDNEIENYFTNINNISIESIFLLENDLKIGFFKTRTIKAGEIFTFYVEISEPYGILDFCMSIEDYDIKLRITNLTEGREVYNESEVTIFHCPLKLTMFFTRPGIFQFDIDNSYSWIRSKTIKYKVNRFYPQKPYYIGRRIILMKYQETILNSKKLNNINATNIKSKEKIFLVKFNGQNNSFNCLDTNLNIEISNKMVRDNYLKISSIYIDKKNENEKSYFYYKNNDKLIQNELTKDIFMNYINENIISNSKANIDIINLYIISGDSNIIDTHYISIEDILGFEPEIKNENNNCKLLFFMQYLHQAQLIYSLFNSINNDEKIDVVLLVNYMKFSGYQIGIYKEGEIFLKMENLDINKNESLEKNMELLAEKIKEFGEEKKIEILIAENIDEEDKEINAVKIGDEIMKKLGMNMEEKGNLKVTYLNKNFNKEVSLNSHIFYLDE
jgi:hypothetical protein